MVSKKRKNRKVKGGITKLPEDLLIHILSFLPTKVATLTTVLSKRWQNLVTLTPNFDLHDSIFRQLTGSARSSFAEFVNRVLVLRSVNSPITKFSLICHRPVNENIVTCWLVEALKRGAIDVTFSLFFPPRGYSLPSSIFSYSQNLIKLSLGSGKLDLSTQGDFAFTKLKNLHLTLIEFVESGNGLAMLISKCHVLENLVLRNCVWTLTAVITCSTLKRLTIDLKHDIPRKFCKELQSKFNPHTRLAFDTPNLLYLKYSDSHPRNYPMVELGSLVEATLNLGLTIGRRHGRVSHNNYEIDGKAATDLIMRIQNIQTLHLFSATLEVLDETIPVFRNLNHLSIKIGSYNEGFLLYLPSFLINCPNLQSLTIHGQCDMPGDGFLETCDYIFASCSSCLSSCPVKVLKILKFGATCEEMSLVKYFLKNLNMLEQVVIICSGYGFVDLSQVSEELKMSPKASLNCKLEVRT